MTEFRIDLLDSTGTRVGDGPLDSVMLLEDVKSLDAIGALTFAIPAADERAQYIVAGAQFDAYDRVDGYLGRFYYRSKNLDASAAYGSRLIVQAHDQLVELARQSVHFRLTYTAQAVDVVIAALIAMVSGWTATTDAGIGTTSVMYEGESVFRAIDVLRDRWNKHFRLGAARVLEFGAFGADSGVVLTNLKGQVQSEIDANTTLAIVEKVALVEEADEIFNKLIPLGAGQGVAQLTIEEATMGAYAVQTGVNANGSNYFYIEDAGSVLLYGRRERILTLPQIRPITNSDANILNAANALKLSAEAYLARHLAPRVTYAVTVRALRTEIAVGDLVRLQYRGIVDNYAYVDVDQTFYVMDVLRQRQADGTRAAQLTIATLAERRTADTDIMLDVVSDLRALKINVPITLTYNAVGPYVKRIDSTHQAEFTVRIGAEVTFLNYAILRFRTSPLKTSITAVSTVADDTRVGEASSKLTADSQTHTHTVTASGGHTHDVTIGTGGGHTHDVTIGSSGSHAHTITIAASTISTTGDGGNHSHEISVVGSGGLSGNAISLTTGGVLFWANASDPANPGTAAAIDHSHDVTHGHTGSTASNEPHTHSATGGAASNTHTHSAAAGAASNTHDHSIGASGSHDHGMAHTHNVVIPGHNHTLTYGIYEDTLYPKGIEVVINGYNATLELGGPWAATNASVEVEVEITSYLVNAVGGLRQNHRIALGCGTQQGEIEAEIDVLASIQAIAMS